MTGCTAHGQRLSASVGRLRERERERERDSLLLREARGTPYGVRGIPAVWVRVGVVC